jgi:hypothetical protein
MNDHELERMLRSQAGPRERGYRARQLAEPAARPGGAESSILRVAVLASAVAAAALVVAIGAAALLPRSPIGVGAGSSSPSASATPPPSQATPSSNNVAACTESDVDLGAEAWGGAAGSRGTLITLALREGRSACTLGQATGAWLTDAAGTTLVDSGPMNADAVALLLDGEQAYAVGVAWSNWCGADVDGNVAVHLRLLGGLDLDVVPDGGAAAVPPCMGDEPTSLSVTALQPAP